VIKAKVTQYVAGDIKNTACVDAPQVPGMPDDCDEAYVTPKKPGVSIEKTVDGVEQKQVALNQAFTYQLVVKNTGAVDLTNVVVTDNAPAHVQFISADKCDWQVDVRTLRNHRMIIENLRPSTTYSYRVQFITPEGAGVTTDRTFVTP
jgi:uncharacterized repeat protein (TIGR01451 family)